MLRRVVLYNAYEKEGKEGDEKNCRQVLCWW